MSERPEIGKVCCCLQGERVLRPEFGCRGMQRLQDCGLEVVLKCGDWTGFVVEGCSQVFYGLVDWIGTVIYGWWLGEFDESGADDMLPAFEPLVEPVDAR